MLRAVLDKIDIILDPKRSSVSLFGLDTDTNQRNQSRKGFVLQGSPDLA